MKKKNDFIKKLNLGLLLLVVFSVIACGDSDDENNLPPPAMNQQNPAPQQPYNNGNPPPYDPGQPGYGGVDLPVGTTVLMSTSSHQGLKYSFPYPIMNYTKYRLNIGDTVRVRGSLQGGTFTTYFNGKVKCMSVSTAYIPLFINGISQSQYLSSSSAFTVQQSGVLELGIPSNYYGNPFECTKLENFRIEIIKNSI